MGDPGIDEPELGSTWADAVDGLTRALQVGADLQRRMMRSSLSSLEVGPGYLRDAQAEWRRYAREVSAVTVDYYRAVETAARDYGERLAAHRDAERHDAGHHDAARHVGDDDGGGRRPGAQEDSERPVIELRGRTGSVLAASFAVENRDPVAAVVTVTPGLARAPDGERFVAPLSVDPASVRIPAGGAAEVSLRLPLLAEVFDPDVAYRVPLRVDGPRPTTIEVVVIAEQAAPPRQVAGSSKVPGSDAAERASGSSADDETVAYRVCCPACGRTFERRTADLRLRPHKDPDGDDCPERDGRRVRR